MKGLRVVVWGLMLASMIAPGRLVAQSLEEWVQQGNAALEAKNYPEAERVWRRVVQLDPKNAVAFSNLCEALLQENKLDEAIAISFAVAGKD